MANKSLRMHKIKQILLLLSRDYSQRSIETQSGVNRRTIAAYSKLFLSSGFTFAELLLFSDQELETYLLQGKKRKVIVDPRRKELEELFPYFQSELKRIGVTRLLLWEEYIAAYPEGFQYSRFCELFQEQVNLSKATMHFDHEPAKVMEVDFAGDMLEYVDGETGEVFLCPVLVAVLPYSGLTYVEVLPNAKLSLVLKSLNNALDYFQAVPLAALSDNMKQWVKRSNRYEPVFNEFLEQWASHNNIALLAARVAKPKDKSSVENAVNIAYKRIYAPLRNTIFSSLNELSMAVRKQLDAHNGKNFQKKSFSRRELYEQKEKDLMQQLPLVKFALKHYTKAKVQRNYHVVIGEDKHYYSVPFRLIGKQVRIVYCTDHVEIYHNNNRVAVHVRSYKKYGYSTEAAHRPPKHAHYTETMGWNPNDYISQAASYGENTSAFMQKVLASKANVEHTYHACQGIIKLANKYSDRIENACKRALKGYRYTYHILKNILDNNTDLLENTNMLVDAGGLPIHENIRGAEAYNQ